jgi:hypothetical protein
MVSADKQTLAAIPQAGSSNPGWPLILLVTLTLVRGLFYLSIFPPFLAPDESAHFEAIRLIGQEKKWPTAQVYAVTPMHPEMVATFEKFRIWQLVNLYSPTRTLNSTSNLFIDYYPTQIAGSEVVADSYLMLYHLTLAPLAALLTPLDLTTQVYLLRSVSVLFAAATLVIAWFTVRLVFPTQPALALVVGSFITFWPMHTHVDASVTADALAELLASAFFLILVIIWQKGVSVVRAVILLGLLGLALLTKPTTFFLLPTLAAVLVIYLGQRWKWSSRLTYGWLILLVGVTLVGSILLHENSEGGRKLLSLLAVTPVWPNWSRFVTTQAFSLYLSSLNFAVLSFAGLFGWSNIHIPWMWVRIGAVVLFFIILGGSIFCYQHLVRPRDYNSQFSYRQRALLIVFLSAITFSFIGGATPIIVSQSPSWGIHSRYYFPAIIPIALYLFFGFQQLFPSGWRSLALPVWVIGWIGYDTLVLIWVVLPYLYG